MRKDASAMAQGKKAGISPTRAEDFPQWFQSVVRDAEVAELDHVRGCMVIRPWGYGIWELMQRAMDDAIKATGAENAYFPLFIPLNYIAEEAEHVEGFAKEMAVVTHHRLEKDADGELKPAAELSEPLVVRPTSETIIGRSFAKWINSYRDLPLLINQWANIVRWELRPRVLLRTTEFLWQEGHTAHATEDEAREETTQMLEVYRRFAEEVIAVPVLTGEKPESERFPGAVTTLSIEAMMQDGKALQAGTSHYLGTNFSEAMDMDFTAEDGTDQFAHTTSWGTSTRLMGALVMCHGDDNGLRVPPRVAPQQIVIVPIARDDPEQVMESARALAGELGAQRAFDVAVRATVDEHDRKPADKRWEYIRKGAPLVVELGGRDIEGGVVTVTRRNDDGLEREQIPREEFVSGVGEVLEGMQGAYFDEAKQRLDERTTTGISDVDAFRDYFSGDDTDSGGFVRAPWSEDPETEKVMGELGVTVRCVPFDQNLADGAKCVISGADAKVEAIFAKAY
jgi:prolyl-tRNA synthetase